MPLFPKAPVTRRFDGRFDITISEPERRVLRIFLEQLRDLLLGDDPLLRRLFPPAYAEDAEREQDYQRLMKGDLLESRFAAIEVMEATLDEDVVDETTLTRWMQAINALRLVAGTRLDVSETPERPRRNDPDFQLKVLYEELGWLLAEIVNVLSEGLPEPTETGPEL